MDYNYLLAIAGLSLGPYDPVKETFKILPYRRRLTWVFMAVNWLVAFKALLLMFFTDAIFLLNEMYIVRGNSQKCKFAASLSSQCCKVYSEN